MPSLNRAIGFVLAFTVCACSSPATEHDCQELLDLYTDKLTDQARPKTEPSERAKLKAMAREKASRDPEFHQCTRRVTLSQVQCAKAAHDADEIERCLM
jgi:hypothetical protein